MPQTAIDDHFRSENKLTVDKTRYTWLTRRERKPSQEEVYPAGNEIECCRCQQYLNALTCCLLVHYNVPCVLSWKIWTTALLTKISLYCSFQLTLRNIRIGVCKH